MDLPFSSLNPYQSLEVLEANSPQELVDALKKIITPVKIVQIVTVGSRQVAYIMGDVRKPKPKKGV